MSSFQRGSFYRIMQRGKKKVKTTPQTQALLCEFSDKNHALIAKVIASWMREDLKNNVRNN